MANKWRFATTQSNKKRIKVHFLNLSRSEKQGKNAAAYDTEWRILQKTFLKLKISGLETKVASNREQLMMAQYSIHKPEHTRVK